MNVSQVALDAAGWISVQGPHPPARWFIVCPLLHPPQHQLGKFSERPLVSGEEEVTSGFIMRENGLGAMQTRRPEVSWAYEEGESGDRD